MQARGFLNDRLNYCWPKVVYCRLYVYQMNLKGKLTKKLWGPSKNLGGHGPPRLPLRIATGHHISFSYFAAALQKGHIMVE